MLCVVCEQIMFLPLLSESGEELEEEEESREISASIGTKIDDLEETLERKLRLDSTSPNYIKCIGGILKILLKWFLWLKNKEHQDWV